MLYPINDKNESGPFIKSSAIKYLKPNPDSTTSGTKTIKQVKGSDITEPLSTNKA